MATTKEKIFNITLSALLLAKEVAQIDTDKSNEVRILKLHWDIALESTLKDLNLDSLSTPITLELIEELDGSLSQWRYVYKYPANCALLRRIVSGFTVDNSQTLINKRVGIHLGQKVIFCNEEQAVAECVPLDLPLSALSGMATQAVALKLGILACPLITGKGAKGLREELKKDYVMAKMEAQEDDAIENLNYESEEMRSEFVRERMS